MMFSLRALVCLFFISCAAVSDAAINFSYVGVGFAHDKVSDAEASCNQSGIVINGAIPLNEFFYAVAEHLDETSSDWCGVTKTQAGAGMHHAINETADGYAEARILFADYPWDEHVGLAFTGGVRAMILYGTELKGFFTYESIDGNADSLVGFGANLWMNKDFSGFFDIAFGDETKQRIQLGVRYNF